MNKQITIMIGARSLGHRVPWTSSVKYFDYEYILNKLLKFFNKFIKVKLIEIK